MNNTTDDNVPLIIQHFKILQKRGRKPKQKSDSYI